MEHGEPHHHPNLVFTLADVEAIREKVARYDWARNLYRRIKTAVDGGTEAYYPPGRRFSMANPDPGMAAFPDEGPGRGADHVHQNRLWEMAMVGHLSGEDGYFQRVRQLLLMATETFVRERDLAEWPQLFVWSHAQDALDLLNAYDLVYDHRCWSDDDHRIVEERFRQIVDLCLREPSSRHLVNTGFYYQPFKVGCGCFFGRQEWIDEGLSGPGGFYDALRAPDLIEERGRWDWYTFGEESPHRMFQRLGRGTADGMLWNEHGIYGSVMLSQYCLIADMMKNHDGTDLWDYRSPHGGGSIRGMFDGFVAMGFPFGEVALFGENGMYDHRLPGHDDRVTSGMHLFHLPRKHIATTKFDLAYARYRNPGYGWLALQDPNRDANDGKLGFTALWYGLDASEMEVSPPDAKSVTFPTFGSAMLRSTEGPDFWSSETPAVAVTWGPGTTYRAHADRMHFTLGAMGTILEPDLAVPWDYGVPQGGRNLTPFTVSSYAHNVLVVDGRNHGMAPAHLVIDDYGEQIKVLGLAGDQVHPGGPHDSVEMGRWLGVTKEYVLDITYIERMSLPHRFDLVIPAYGDLSVPGVEFEDYDMGADLGFHEIDTASNHPENRWLTEGKRAVAPKNWTARFENDDGVNLAIHSDNWDDSEILAGRAPVCWAPYLEEGQRKEPEPLRDRYTILVHRKHRDQTGGKVDDAIPWHSEDHAHFFTVHEPFRDAPRIRSVRRVPLEDRRAQLWTPFGVKMAEGTLNWTTPRVMEIRADTFTDYFIYIDHFIALRAGEPGRAVLETPAFRVDFRGAYVYLRMVEGKVAAVQGKVEEAVAVA